MPCFFATPMHHYAMPSTFATPTHHYAMPRMCYRRSAPCFAPCLAPILTLATLLCLPALIRLGLMVFFGLVHIAAHMLFTFGFVVLVGSAVRALLHDEEADDDGSKAKGPSSARCFAKMKACAQRARTDSESAHESETVHKKERRHDLSSARIEPTSEGCKVVVSAPGVAPGDLNVSVLEHSLNVKGETKRGMDVFCVDQHIVPPRLVDVNTATCTHADGEVMIVLSKKIGKRIPITAAAVPATRADDQASTTEEAVEDAAVEAAVREVTGEGSEGEWEPLA